MTIDQEMMKVRAREINTLPAHLAGTELQAGWIHSSSATDQAALYELYNEAGECKGYLVQEKEGYDGEIYNHIHNEEGEYVQELQYLALEITNINDLMQ